MRGDALHTSVRFSERSSCIGVAVIMTNQGTALNTFDGKDAQVIPERVVGRE